MEKLQGTSMDIVQDNIEKLKQIFPEIFTEGKIDYQVLKQLLGEHIEIDKERYSFTWKGKTQARQIAQDTSTGTLRPDKDNSKDWENTENLYIEGDNKMNKRDFNVVGNEGTDNQELAKGIAFIKSRRAELNVVQMVENMRDQAMPNGVIINDAYCDRSITRDYDREALNAFFATLKEEDFEVVVVRSLNEITDDIYDLEEFVKTITDMGIWLYSLEVGPVPIIASHAEDFGC